MGARVHQSLVRPRQGACRVAEGPPVPEQHDGMGVAGAVPAPAGGERGSAAGTFGLIALAWWVACRFPLLPSFRRHPHGQRVALGGSPSEWRGHCTPNPIRARRRVLGLRGVRCGHKLLLGLVAGRSDVVAPGLLQFFPWQLRRGTEQGLEDREGPLSPHFPCTATPSRGRPVRWLGHRTNIPEMTGGPGTGRATSCVETRRPPPPRATPPPRNSRSGAGEASRLETEEPHPPPPRGASETCRQPGKKAVG